MLSFINPLQGKNKIDMFTDIQAKQMYTCDIAGLASFLTQAMVSKV